MIANRVKLRGESVLVRLLTGCKVPRIIRTKQALTKAVTYINPILCCLAAGVLGCSNSNWSELSVFQIVERSKRSRPSWMLLKHEVIHESDTLLKFVHARRNQVDIQLAVKQAEAGARNHGRMALIKIAKNRQKSAGRRNNSVEAASRAGSGVELASLDTALSKKIAKKIANRKTVLFTISDIYFEKLRSKSGEYTFDVYVFLTAVPSDVFEFLGE